MRTLPEPHRQVVEAVRRHTARVMAAEVGMTFEEALASVTELHENGFLTMVQDHRGVALVPVEPHRCYGNR
jgi:hypothetical protein